MKKLMIALAALLAFGMLTAFVPEDFESSIPLDKAAELFQMMDAIFDTDGGELWGFPLHGPFMFADTITRHAVANMPDPQGFFTPMDGVYVGVLPGGVFIGNTSIEFRGLSWGMMSWGDAFDFEDHTAAVLGTMVHEVFHAVQSEVTSGRVRTQEFPHMENLDARVRVVLEMAALMEALRTEGEERLEAIHTALSARADRWERYRLIAPIPEINMEILEGVAVYTELMLVLDNRDDRLEYLELRSTVLAGRSALNLFGYWSGAMYAMLLDEAGIDWKYGLTFNTDLAALLKEGLGITELTPFEALDLERFGYSQITAVEKAWVEAMEWQRAEARRIFGSARPILFLPGQVDITTAELLEVLQFHFQELGLVFYGYYSMTGSWGYLHFHGAFERLDFTVTGRRITAADMEITNTGAFTPTWELVLNDYYEIRPDADGRNFTVVRR